jgi:hypothetical protein
LTGLLFSTINDAVMDCVSQSNTQDV